MKKIFLLGAIIIMSLISLVGCGGNTYNAVLYSHAEDWISEEFLSENKVKAYYPNKDYVEGESDSADRYIYDKESPTSRTFIISKQNEFDEICSKYNSTIDFDSQIIILYVFADVNPNRDYNLDKIILEEQSLRIYYRLERKNLDDTTAPYPRCFMIKMDKVDIMSVELIEK